MEGEKWRALVGGKLDGALLALVGALRFQERAVESETQGIVPSPRATAQTQK